MLDIAVRMQSLFDPLESPAFRHGEYVKSRRKRAELMNNKRICKMLKQWDNIVQAQKDYPGASLAKDIFENNVICECEEIIDEFKKKLAKNNIKKHTTRRHVHGLPIDAYKDKHGNIRSSGRCPKYKDTDAPCFRCKYHKGHWSCQSLWTVDCTLHLHYKEEGII